MLAQDFETNFSNLSPFEFFAIHPNFILDFDLLRSKYFEICKQFQGINRKIIEQAHTNFYQLNNDLSRLHVLYKIFGVKEDTEQTAVPLEIQEMSEQLFEADPKQLQDLLKTLKNLRDEKKKDIQEEFEHFNWEKIKKLEIELSYCLRLIDSAYRLMKKEE